MFYVIHVYLCIILYIIVYHFYINTLCIFVFYITHYRLTLFNIFYSYTILRLYYIQYFYSQSSSNHLTFILEYSTNERKTVTYALILNILFEVYGLGSLFALLGMLFCSLNFIHLPPLLSL